MRPQTKQPLTVQEQYLRKHKSHHRQVSFLRFFLLGIFLLLWEVSADLDWIDSFFSPVPTESFCALENYGQSGPFRCISVSHC